MTTAERRSAAQALADRYDAGDRNVSVLTFATRRAALWWGLQIAWHALVHRNTLAPKGWNNTLIAGLCDGEAFWTHLVKRVS